MPSALALPSLDPHWMTPTADHQDQLKEKIHSVLPHGKVFAPHHPGQRALKRIQKAYEALYRVTGLDSSYSLLCSHSIAAAQTHLLFSIYMDYGRKCGRGHFIASKNSTGPILMQLERLTEIGATFDLVRPKAGGGIDIEHLRSLITPRTQLLSLSYVDPHTGLIEEIGEILEICRERGVFLHLDLSHSWYQLPDKMQNIASLGADLITIDGAACGASFGGALLILRPGIRIEPLLPSGTPLLSYLDLPPECIWDLALALEATSKQSTLVSMRVPSKKRALQKKLTESFSKAHLPQPLFPFAKQYRLEKKLPSIEIAPCQLLIVFPTLHSEHLAFLLAEKGLTFSIGGGPSQQLHYLLRDSQLPSAYHHSALTLRLDSRLSSEELDWIAQTITECAALAHKSAFSMEIN